MGNTTVTPKKEVWQPKFIKWLCKTGNVTASCLKAKISRRHAYATRKEDPLFAEAWDEALGIATELLEEEARRRAQDGVLEPVYQDGKLAGKVRKYSDTLLIFLLKAHKPDKYRENHHHKHVGANDGPIEIELDDTERSARIASLLDAARERRDRSLAENGQGDLEATTGAAS